MASAMFVLLDNFTCTKVRNGTSSNMLCGRHNHDGCVLPLQNCKCINTRTRRRCVYHKHDKRMKCNCIEYYR